MPNRTLCDVLKEIRTCYETRSFSSLLGLVEEVQTLANRMEAALWDQGDLEYARDELSELKKEKKKLEQEIKILKNLKPEEES